MQNILQHYFDKNSLKEIPVETLRQFTRDYPLFPIGHYLLTKKLQETNDPGFQDQLQKTALYFHNPLWLEYKLNEPENADRKVKAQQVLEDHETPAKSEERVTHDMVEEVVLQQEKPIEAQEPTEEIENIDEDPDATEGPGEHERQSHEEDKLSFQAYHTVDYFASQGIKLSQDNKSEDRLGKQLKSFTEWLKTMRKLPQAIVEEVLEKTTDKEVEQYAAHSLEENEIVTEAMAEVLMKQGKKDKARELYHKLSLLNPHKSAYFAAKIEALNQH